jgi:hypothetical protein
MEWRPMELSSNFRDVGTRRFSEIRSEHAPSGLHPRR